eukprot:CFRG4060T1
MFCCFGSSESKRIELDHGTKVKVREQIGEGGFSYVYEARDDSGQKYALKKILLQTRDQISQFKREIEMHRNFLGNNCIIRMYDSSQQTEALGTYGMILLELVTGTLEDVIQLDGVMDESKALVVFKQICKAVRSLHSFSPSYAHRDLKPANVAYRGPDKEVALMDLGSASLANVNISSRKEAIALQEACAEHCTAPFRAPELFEVASDAKITAATDVWSLGCILYFLLFGKLAFDGSATAAVSGRVTFPQERKRLNSYALCHCSTILLYETGGDEKFTYDNRHQNCCKHTSTVQQYRHTSTGVYSVQSYSNQIAWRSTLMSM